MLVVEDDGFSIMAMKMIFQTDYEIFVCDSAEEYYEKYSKINYDIIIMDILLNGQKNGLEFMKEIKAVPSYNHTPIVCLTAHAQTELRQIAIQSGVDLFITKPVSNKVLKEAVAALIDKNQI